MKLVYGAWKFMVKFMLLLVIIKARMHEHASLFLQIPSEWGVAYEQ